MIAAATKCPLLFMVIHLVLSDFAQAAHFRGGTISWHYIGPGNRVEFKFKLAWSYGRADNSLWSAIRLSDGNDSTIFSDQYKQFASNPAEGWEEEQRVFKADLLSPGPFSVFFKGGAWISLSNGGGGGGDWKIETTVDLHNRSDTHMPNQSPMTTSRAIYRVQFGCPASIQIPVLDADGDIVRCRLATPDEALSIGENQTDAQLDQSRCRIRLTVNENNGFVLNEWFSIAVTIEDFPRKPITINGEIYDTNTPISKVPLQFLVRPQEMKGPCGEKPVFVNPTLHDRHVISIKAKHNFTSGFYIHSNYGINVVDITGPIGLQNSSIQPDDQGRPNVWKVDITWTPEQPDTGTHIICASAEDTQGKLSDSRCIFVVAWDIDPCESSPCVHLGTCKRVGVSEYYVCSCIPGYTGKNCQTDINECSSNPCQHGGNCLDLVNEYRCHCEDGYTGFNCETDIDECFGDPCRNGATCRDLVNGYICHCAPGYTSIHCEIDFDECSSNPCQNNGTCVDEVASWYCACQPGFTAIHCQTEINECLSSPCRNSGTCIDIVDGFNCLCTNDFTGDYCEAWMNHCVSHPCLHGGVCENHLGGFTCSCPDPWNGDICEFRDINKTEECTDFEYTECSCHITLPKQPIKKSYIIEIGTVGMMVGLFVTITFYITWSLRKVKLPSSNKIHDSDTIFVKGVDKTGLSDIKERQQGCICFVDYTGYDHFQRRSRNDKHNYRYHKCRGKQSKLDTFTRSSYC